MVSPRVKVKGKKDNAAVVKTKGKKKMTEKVTSPNIINTEKKLKLWDLYYEERNKNFSSKATYRSDIEVPRIITAKLTEEQLVLLKRSCFGDFIDVGRPQMFSQLIQHALVREVYQKNPNEMWFLFGKERVRFALSDFCLISGLSGKGNEDISSFNGTENHLINKFFQGEAVTRLAIKRIYQGAHFDDDEEAVRMSIIFLVCNFIMGNVEDNLVDTALLNFLSYGELDTYPWGKAAFQLTMKSLSQALKGHFSECDGGSVIYNLYKDRYCKAYKLNGLPYVFQVFMFETIPTIKEQGFCFEDKRSAVKLFNWKEIGKAPFYDKLNEFVFATGKLRIQMLIPTEKETVHLEYGGFRSDRSEKRKRGNSDINKKSKVRKGEDRSEKVREEVSPLDDFKGILDAHLKPLKKKLKEVKEEVKELRVDVNKLRVDVRDDLHAFRVEIVGIITSALKKNERSDVEHDDRGGSYNYDFDEGSEVKKNDRSNEGNDGGGEVQKNEEQDDGGEVQKNEEQDDGGEVQKNEEQDGLGEEIAEVQKNEGHDDGGEVQKNEEQDGMGKEIVVYTPNKVVEYIAHLHKSESKTVVFSPGEISESKTVVFSEEAVKDADIPRFNLLSQISGSQTVILSLTPEVENKCVAKESSVLDEVSLNTQDLNYCVEIEKNVIEDEGRATRATVKRHIPLLKGLSSFSNICMGMPSLYEDALFQEWFKVGFNNRKWYDKFPGENNKIEPALSFGWISIDSKMWFYKLKTPGQYLDSNHIDVLFYYLRKIARHCPDIQIKVTTTDCWFHEKLTSLYKTYSKKNQDKSVISANDGVIAEYIQGFLMNVNTPWANVNYVLFPVHMNSPDHWFLMIFDIGRRKLVIYNSLNPTSSSIRKKITIACKPYSVVLPIILSQCGFWNDRSDNQSKPFVEKEGEDMGEVEFAEGMLVQSDSDCGVFTICYAEHFIFQKVEEIPNPFPVSEYRNKLCVNLYIHALNKQVEGYDSDTEYPGNPHSYH